MGPVFQFSASGGIVEGPVRSDRTPCKGTLFSRYSQSLITSRPSPGL